MFQWFWTIFSLGAPVKSLECKIKVWKTIKSRVNFDHSEFRWQPNRRFYIGLSSLGCISCSQTINGVRSRKSQKSFSLITENRICILKAIISIKRLRSPLPRVQQCGGGLRISSDRDDRMGGKHQNPKKSLDQNLTLKEPHAEFPCHKNFQKALNDITQK